MSAPSSTSKLRLRLPLTLAVMAMLLLAPSTAAAKVEREILFSDEPSNLVSISPVRIDREVSPGDHLTEQVTILNDSAKPVKITATPIDLGPPHDETLLTEPLRGKGEFGAGDWITPEITDIELKPFERIKFDVVIEPPADAPVGSSYGGVEFLIGDPSGETSTQVKLRVTSILQMLLTVPGPVKQKLTILEAKTRDSFHVGNTSFVTYGTRYRNDGTVSDHVKGKVVVTSMFGNKAAEIPLKERTLIRGATGSSRLVWSNPPKFGIFHSKLEIQGDDGKVQTRDLGRVIILPPWWLIALIIAALVLPPVFLWWRRRREWMLYMDDDEWDTDGDEHAAY